MSATVELACELIRRPSLTPKDEGCQALMCARLEAIGFKITPLRFGEVDNFWAVRGDSGPMLCFAGHTDVVPTGPEADWATPPFEPIIKAGVLYGRGAADMKSSLAAMVTATENFIAQHPDHSGRIAFLITSDEEGPAHDGTVRVVNWLREHNTIPDWCLVGEPSSKLSLGDVIKNGRRGSLNAKLLVKGLQGHVAYPELADNPIHRAAPALAALANEVWDQGNAYFPATTFQISNIAAGEGVTNVIPGTLTLLFNFRYSTELTAEELKARTCAILDQHQLSYELEWQLSGEPFLTPEGRLATAATDAIAKVRNTTAALSTSGGTSDGRFIAPLGTQVLELGPINATIHQVNECVLVQDIDDLSEIYQHILSQLLNA
ncbi:MAG: succinyl-diaminopimelate desuccinylase [Porticoccaceae bacterium]